MLRGPVFVYRLPYPWRATEGGVRSKPVPDRSMSKISIRAKSEVSSLGRSVSEGIRVG